MSDEQVLEAALRVMGTSGPGELSLAEIGREAGVTSGALVQRFGSKRNLMLWVSEQWADGTDGMLRHLRDTVDSPLAAVRRYATRMAHLGQSPGALAHHLGYLQIDLTDSDFRAHMRRSAVTTWTYLVEWLEEAVEMGELRRPPDVGALARLIEAVVGGALLTWAVHQDGTARQWVRRHVDAAIAPYEVV